MLLYATVLTGCGFAVDLVAFQVSGLSSTPGYDVLVDFSFGGRCENLLANIRWQLQSDTNFVSASVSSFLCFLGFFTRWFLKCWIFAKLSWTCLPCHPLSLSRHTHSTGKYSAQNRSQITFLADKQLQTAHSTKNEFVDERIAKCSCAVFTATFWIVVWLFFSLDCPVGFWFWPP